MGSDRREVKDDSSDLSVVNWKNGIVSMDGRRLGKAGFKAEGRELGNSGSWFLT